MKSSKFKPRITRSYLAKANNYDIAAYFLISSISTEFDTKEWYYSFKRIESRFNVNVSARKRNELKKSISKYALKKINNSSWIFDKTLFLIDKDFVEISNSDVEKIFKSGNYNLFAFYAKVLNTINWYDKVGTLPLSYLAKICNCTTNTVVSYTKQLEELGLLYVIHSTGNSYSTNIYARPENSELADTYASENRIRNSKETNTSKKRSLGHKYSWFMKGKEYSQKELQEILEYTKEYNDKEHQKHLFNSLYKPKYLDNDKLKRVLATCNK